MQRGGREQWGGRPLAAGALRLRRASSAVGLALLAALLLAGAVVWWRWSTFQAATVSSDTAWLDAPHLELGAAIAGRISRLYGEQGDVVVRGQILGLLDQTELLAGRSGAQAEASLARRELALARRNSDATRVAFRHALTAYRCGELSASELGQARQALRLSRHQLQAAFARLELARAQLALVARRLAHSQIVAPRDGVIGRRLASPGSTVAAGQPIFTLFDPSALWVTILLDERSFTRVRLGDSLSLRLTAYPDERFTGRLFMLGGAAADWPGDDDGRRGPGARIAVRATLRPLSPARTAPRLLPGMSGRVTIHLGRFAGPGLVWNLRWPTGGGQAGCPALTEEP